MVVMTVRPESHILRINPMMIRAVLESRPDVGSSRNTMAGCEDRMNMSLSKETNETSDNNSTAIETL